MLIKQSDIRAVLLNKLCGEGGFIRVPEGAEYSAEDATNVLLHAATSSSNSIESAAIPVVPINAYGRRVDYPYFRKHLRTMLRHKKDNSK